MTDTTKLDLSLEEKYRALYTEACELRHQNRALLDRAEAAERGELAAQEQLLAMQIARDEARASVAAAWEAGRDAAQHLAHEAWNFRLAQNLPDAIRALTNPDPSATEALRRVKEAVWDEGHEAGESDERDEATCKLPYIQRLNPYRKPKEAAHD